MGYSGLNYKTWNGAEKLPSRMCSLQEQEALPLSQTFFYLCPGHLSKQLMLFSIQGGWSYCLPSSCSPSTAHHCSSFLVQLTEMWLAKGWAMSLVPSMSLWREKDLCESRFLLVSWQLQTTEIWFLGMTGIESSWVRFSQTSLGFQKCLIYMYLCPK